MSDAELSRDIESLVEDAEKEILRESFRWMINNLDDYDVLFSQVLFTATFKSNDPAFVGQFVIDMARETVERAVKRKIDS